MLHNWRTFWRYSIAELASEIGISRAALQRFENGEEVSNKNFIRIWNWVSAESPDHQV